MYKSSSELEGSRYDKPLRYDKKQYLGDSHGSTLPSVVRADKGKEHAHSHRRASAPLNKPQRKSRSRAHSTASGETLLLLLREQERDAHNARQLLRSAMDEVDASAARLADAERDRRALAQAQVAQQLQAQQATVQAQAGTTRAQHELQMYKLQLEAAQSEIKRAQNVVQMMQDQRDDAERAAAKARTVARRLKEEQIVVRAREQGRMEGYSEGVERARMLSEFAEDGREAIYYAIRSAGADPRLPGDGSAYIEEEVEDVPSRHTPSRSARSARSSASDTEATRPRDRTSPRSSKPPSETTTARRTSASASGSSSRSSRRTSVTSPPPVNYAPPSNPSSASVPVQVVPPTPPSPPRPVYNMPESRPVYNMPEPMTMPEPDVQENVPDAFSPQPIPIPPPKQYATRTADRSPRAPYVPRDSGVSFPQEEEPRRRRDSMSSAGGYPSGSRGQLYSAEKPARARRDSVSTTSSTPVYQGSSDNRRSRKDSASTSSDRYAYAQPPVSVMHARVPAADVDPYGLGKPDAERSSMRSSRSGVTGDIESELGRNHAVEATMMPYMPMPPPPQSYLQRQAAERPPSVPPQGAQATRARRDSQSSSSSAGYGGYRPPSVPYGQPPPMAYQQPPPRSAPTPPVYAQQYAQPQQPVYAPTPPASYAQPQASVYGQPPPATQPAAYGRPQVSAYGQPPAPIYGRGGSHRRTRSASDSPSSSTTGFSQFDLTTFPAPRGPLSVIPEDVNSLRSRSYESTPQESPRNDVYGSHATPQWRVQPPDEEEEESEEEEEERRQRASSRSSKSPMYGNRRNVADWAETSSESTPPVSTHQTSTPSELLTPEYRPRNQSREDVAADGRRRRGDSADSRRSTDSSSVNIVIEPPSRPTSISGGVSGGNSPIDNIGLLSPHAMPTAPVLQPQPPVQPFIPAMPVDSEPDDGRGDLPPWIRQQQAAAGPGSARQQAQGIYGQTRRAPSAPEPPVPVPGPHNRNNYTSSSSSGSETDSTETEEARRTSRASRPTTPSYAVAPQPPGFSYPSPLAGPGPSLPGTPGGQQRRMPSVYAAPAAPAMQQHPAQGRSGVRRASVSYATPGSAGVPVQGTPVMGPLDGGGAYGMARSTSESDGDVDPATMRNTLANAGSRRY
ncbi:hypothetical protein BD626DRAFT_481530 [Schizophyllum amplum]|uniref:Uncharacterized protein n=1 Tax=Schizophyllum amplum TaxID=97359 RepID=A0A550CUB2_9AGAR|nr:hypothetical protein BD626DRAFT_481530 [Auriculariopsis ampla]